MTQQALRASSLRTQLLRFENSLKLISPLSARVPAHEAVMPQGGSDGTDVDPALRQQTVVRHEHRDGPSFSCCVSTLLSVVVAVRCHSPLTHSTLVRFVNPVLVRYGVISSQAYSHWLSQANSLQTLALPDSTISPHSLNLLPRSKMFVPAGACPPCLTARTG
jgi:hypothetical protein